MTRIKICGITEIEHVLIASRHGADLIGLVFASSPRRIPLRKARQLSDVIHSLRTRPTIVGVFVNSTAAEVNGIADYCGLDWVQLSGGESWSYCQEIQHPIIKAIHISPDKTADDVLTEIEAGCRIGLKNGFICLLDTQVRNAYGGTGQVFNWELAEEVTSRFPAIIAGGLTPANTSQLVIQAKPWGVDVSSGVETEGRKDAVKIRAFIDTIRKVGR